MKAEKKCLTCIWADKRSGVKLFCPFAKCVSGKLPIKVSKHG